MARDTRVVVPVDEIRVREIIKAMTPEIMRSARQGISAGWWEPIATAPLDGTQVILFSPNMEPQVGVGWFDPEPYLPADFPGHDAPFGWTQVEGDHAPSAAMPTHWQPLPIGPDPYSGKAAA